MKRQTNKGVSPSPRRIGWVTVVVLVVCAAVPAAAQPIEVSSVDTIAVLGFPIGVYHEIATLSLGVTGKLNLAITTVEGLHPFVQVGNAYWVSMPDYITFGTQLRAIAGAAYRRALFDIGTLGAFFAGAELGYGFLMHLARWDRLDSPTTSLYADQMIQVGAEVGLSFSEAAIDAVLAIGYLFSPEKNDLQKHELDVSVGARFRF